MPPAAMLFFTTRHSPHHVKHRGPRAAGDANMFYTAACRTEPPLSAAKASVPPLSLMLRLPDMAHSVAAHPRHAFSLR